MRPAHREGARVVFATYGNDLYKLVLALHILFAIVGFGAVVLNAVYGQQAKARRGTEGLAIAEANYLVSKIGEFFIYAVFVLGIALVLLGHDVVDFGQTWIWLSMIVFFAALGISHGALQPRVRRMHALMNELIHMGPPQPGATSPPPQVLEMETLGARIRTYGIILNVALITLVVLMVFQPGGPRGGF
jgi:uncharacterized membrane protein